MSKPTLPIYPHTRLLADTFSQIGCEIRDYRNQHRIWTIVGFYQQIIGQAGGIRAKLRDQKGFVTFLNQMDREVLLGISKPGETCRWAGRAYRAPGDEGWHGFCMEGEDLADDLLEKELMMRGVLGLSIQRGTPMTRFLHEDDVTDTIEKLVMVSDGTATSAIDPRIETVLSRWKKENKQAVDWSQFPVLQESN